MVFIRVKIFRKSALPSLTPSSFVPPRFFSGAQKDCNLTKVGFYQRGFPSLLVKTLFIEGGAVSDQIGPPVVSIICERGLFWGKVISDLRFNILFLAFLLLQFRYVFFLRKVPMAHVPLCHPQGLLKMIPVVSTPTRALQSTDSTPSSWLSS